MKNYVGRELNKFLDEVVVFDLDGTLWKVNSHIDILNKHFHTNMYNSIPLKCIAKVFPRFFQWMIDRLYKKHITKQDIQNYKFEFRESAIQILKEQMMKKKRVIIISNAPSEIVDKAGKDLNIEAFTSPVGKKYNILKSIVPDLKELTVVTDNLTDIDLLKMADKQIIYTDKKNKYFFLKQGMEHAVFLDRRGE